MTMPSPSAETRLRQGDFLGPYRIVKRVATGTHWDIYLARSGSAQRQVALKVLRGNWVTAETLADRARLARDASDPHLARIHDVGVDRGRAYVAQEYVTDQRGAVTDLKTERLDHGNVLPEDRVKVLAKQILDGLETAHEFIGGGLAHGQLDEQAVLLNEQRRATIVDMGLLTDATPETKTADLRAAGQLFYRMLTGREFGPQASPPAELGLNRGWNRIIQELTSAQPGSPPDLSDIGERILALEDRRPPRHWAIPAAVALLVCTLALLATVMHRQQERRKKAREAAAVAEQRRTRETIDAILTKARQAQTRGELPRAQSLIAQARQLDPDHHAGARLQADVTMMQGLAAVDSTKTGAEAAWQRIRELDANQGFGALILNVQSTLTAARNALSEQAFDEAEQLYTQAGTQAEAIAELHLQRMQATEVRRTVRQQRDAADAVDAAEFASRIWDEAQQADTQAAQWFESRQFTQALDAWQRAASLYERAAAKADGTHRLTTAKNAFDSAFVAAGREAREAMPAALIQKIEALTARAGRLTESEQWRAAAAIWDEALEVFRNGLEQAEKALREKHFGAAMARGRQLALAGQYLAAEQAFNEALGVKGYGNDPNAMRLRQQVRGRQEGLAAAAAVRQGNLVRNGDFTVGQGGAPVAWTRPDNLTVFWEDGGVSGKCLRLDTDVYRAEWEEHRKHPHIPMKKTPTTGTRYNTVGGTTGVAVYAYPIDVQPGAYYRVGFDVKGQGEPFLYIKGYWKCSAEHLKDLGEKIFFQPVPGGPSFSLVAFGTSGEEKRQPNPGDFIQSFRRRVVARFPPGDKSWRRFETVLQLPPDRPIQVVLLELYAFWPPGNYWFDNVRMEQVAERDFESYQARRRQLGEKANFGTPIE